MKIDMTITFRDVMGLKAADRSGNILTLGTVIGLVLTEPVRGFEDTGIDTIKMHRLWETKIEDKKEADLTDEEAAMIKKRIVNSWGGIVAGPVDKIIKDK
jgi:hypothetical protein